MNNKEDFAKVLDVAEKCGCALWRTKGDYRIFIHCRSQKKFLLVVKNRKVDVFYVKLLEEWLQQLG
jgi:hypothetical protein